MKVAQPPACTNCQTRDNNIILKDCPIDRLEQLNENKSCVAYEKGQNLFHECQPSLGVFCLFTGKVKIFRTGPHGREHIVRLAKPGDLIGYRALLGDESYTATAVTLEDSTACFVPKEEFLTAIKGDNPNIFSRLFKLLSRDLAEAERRLTNMAQKSVRERLAEAILLMDASYGQKNGNSSMIDRCYVIERGPCQFSGNRNGDRHPAFIRI